MATTEAIKDLAGVYVYTAVFDDVKDDTTLNTATLLFTAAKKYSLLLSGCISKNKLFVAADGTFSPNYAPQPKNRPGRLRVDGPPITKQVIKDIAERIKYLIGECLDKVVTNVDTTNPAAAANTPIPPTPPAALSQQEAALIAAAYEAWNNASDTDPNKTDLLKKINNLIIAAKTAGVTLDQVKFNTIIGKDVSDPISQVIQLGGRNKKDKDRKKVRGGAVPDFINNVAAFQNVGGLLATASPLDNALNGGVALPYPGSFNAGLDVPTSGAGLPNTYNLVIGPQTTGQSGGKSKNNRNKENKKDNNDNKKEKKGGDNKNKDNDKKDKKNRK